MPAPTTTTTTTSTTTMPPPGPWVTTSLCAGPTPGTTYDFTICNLSANTVYEYRSYMIVCGIEYCGKNSYQIQTSATPTSIPTVNTCAVTAIGQTSATGSGVVSSDGGASVTARGSAWGLASSPTIAGSHTVDGSGTGTFYSSLTSLSPNTTYYVRAYATNANGTAYGNEVNFMTSAPPTTTAPPSTLISAQVCTDVLNYCIGGVYQLKCCTGGVVETRIIGSPLFNCDSVIWNVPTGCYYVDYSSVQLYCSYMSQPKNGFNWSDDYMYGYNACCTHCFPSGNNSVYGCIY